MAALKLTIEKGYRFFCRNCQAMITVEACLARREAEADSKCSSCSGCSKDTLITRTSRSSFHNEGSRP